MPRSQVLLDVLRLPEEPRICGDTSLDIRVFGEQRGFDLAVVVEAFEKLQLGIREREHSVKPRARLPDEGCRPSFDVASCGPEILPEHGQEPSFDVIERGYDPFDGYGPPVDAVDAAVHYEGEPQSSEVKGLAHEELTRVEEVPDRATGEERRELPCRKLVGIEHWDLSCPIAEKVTRVALHRIPQRHAEHVVDVNLQDRGSFERRRVREPLLAAGMLSWGALHR